MVHLMPVSITELSIGINCCCSLFVCTYVLQYLSHGQKIKKRPLKVQWVLFFFGHFEGENKSRHHWWLSLRNLHSCSQTATNSSWRPKNIQNYWDLVQWSLINFEMVPKNIANIAQNKLPRIILEPFVNTNEWSSHISQKDDSVTLFSDLMSHLKGFPVYQSAPAENKPSSPSPVLVFLLLHHWEFPTLTFFPLTGTHSNYTLASTHMWKTAHTPHCLCVGWCLQS